VATPTQLANVVDYLESIDRIGIDTEADSLHCYREKLCLLQLSIPEHDFVIDPLALSDLHALAAILREREIVLHGADFDLRLLRRSTGLVQSRVLDTVNA